MVASIAFGLTGTAVTNGAVGGGSPSRTTWAQIQPYLNANCGVTFAPQRFRPDTSGHPRTLSSAACSGKRDN